MGAPLKLTTEPHAQLPDLFSKGAEHYGFEGEVWTRLRVEEVIKPHFGVNYEVATHWSPAETIGCYSPTTETLLLSSTLVTSHTVAGGDFARTKKTAKPEDQLVFSGDESACYLLPQVRPTWAPVGQTPILDLRLSSCSFIRDRRD
jgi:hypothetical protein